MTLPGAVARNICIAGARRGGLTLVVTWSVSMGCSRSLYSSLGSNDYPEWRSPAFGESTGVPLALCRPSNFCLPLQRALVETHLRQICGLEQQLKQQQGLRDTAFPSLSPPPAPAPPCADLDLHYLALRGGTALGHGEISDPQSPYPQVPKPNPHFITPGHLYLI